MKIRTPLLSLVGILIAAALPMTAGSANAATYPVSDPHLTFSPYNWDMGFCAAATNPGAYVKFRFSGSSSVSLNLNLSSLPFAGSTTGMSVQWRIDKNLSNWHQLTISDSTLLLGSNLSLGVHDVQMWLVYSDLGVDRWNRTTNINTLTAPSQSLVLDGINLNDGATLMTASTTNNKRILFYGDSITEGYFVDYGYSNATRAFPTTCAQQLHAEYAQIGNGGQGWTGNNAPSTGVPVFNLSWTNLFAAAPRFPTTATPAPEYVVVNMGTNDAFDVYPVVGIRPPAADSQVQANVFAWLQGVRATLPDTKIFIVVPFGGFYENAIQTAVQQYKLTHTQDQGVYCIDLGASARQGLNGYTAGGTPQSMDGLHPLAATSMGLGYQLASAIQTALGCYDFNGDGQSDIIFQNASTNQVAFWCMNGNTAYTSAFLSLTPPPGWQVVGTGDFNGDGKPDLLLQNLTTRQVCVWYLSGTTVLGSSLISSGLYPNWEVRAVADLNGDGKPDLILQNTSTFQVAVWYLDNTTLTGGNFITVTPEAGWRVVGAMDINSDGHPDLIFQNDNTGAAGVWFLYDYAYITGGFFSLPVPAGYHIVGVEDLDGDGRPDLVLQNYQGPIQIWKTNGLQCTSQAITNPDPFSTYGYHIVGPK